jgi:large repetitive protein
MRNIKLLSVLSLLCALILGLANSSSHPTAGNSGYTGAPGDSVCSSCHSGSNPNFNGEINISGLPATILTSTSYTVTITISNPNGNAARAGFQMLALTGSNTNAGSMSNASSGTQIKTVSGKNYFGHSPASNFSGSQNLSFTVNWTSPATVGSNPVISFYASSVLANGNGSTSGDKMVLTTLSVPIQAPASPLSATVVQVSGTSCNNTMDGSASVNITGGMGPYNISWSNGQSNTQTATNLPAGLVSVTVTDSAGASATGSTTIQAPPAINITTTSTPACPNTNSGTASASATGGTGTLTYLWSNGMQGAQISGLTAATYTVSVIDANSCIQTSMVTVGTIPPIIISENIQNISCNGGNNGVINLNVSGGNGNFTYLWSTGQTGAAIGNLPAGTYNVTITSNNQCSTTRSYNISQPLPLVTSVQNVAGAGCEGQSNGTASIVISGGTSPYVTSIQNVGNFSGSVVNLQGLSAGTYSYTVTDQNNCMTSGSFQITSFPALSVSVDLNYNVCGDECYAIANVIPSGGSPPYNYWWCNGSTVQNDIINCLSDCAITVTDQNGCSAEFNVINSPPQPLNIDSSIVAQPLCHSNTGSVEILISGGVGNIRFIWNDGITGSSRSGLTPGEYIVTASDFNMCTATDTILITQPDSLTYIISVTNATEQGSSDGSIELEISGGTPPYTVTWSTGQTSGILDSIPSGIYFFTITDANNCSLSGSAVVNNSFCFITAEVVSISPSCFGSNDGQIIVTPIPDDHQPFIRLFDMSGVEWVQYDSLMAGTYSILITDTLSCIGVVNNIILNDPPQIVADSITAIQPSSDMSSDGILTAYIRGGTGSLSYQWYLNDWPYSNESHIEDLPNGIYDLVVTDSAGCQALFGPFNFLLVGNDEYVIMNENILIFPNPVTDYLVIEWNGSVVKPEIMIITPDGKHIRISEKVEAATNQIRIDTAHLLPGLYTVIFYNGKFRSYKVIKL